jgi:hypothetical protein
MTLTMFDLRRFRDCSPRLRHVAALLISHGGLADLGERQGPPGETKVSALPPGSGTVRTRGQVGHKVEGAAHASACRLRPVDVIESVDQGR